MFNFDYSYLSLPDQFYSLTQINKFPKPESFLINKKLCNTFNILIKKNKDLTNLLLTKNKFYNCAISDWNKKYRQVNTEIYKENPYLNFYNDPYRDISIFFRKS